MISSRLLISQSIATQAGEQRTTTALPEFLDLDEDLLDSEQAIENILFRRGFVARNVSPQVSHVPTSELLVSAVCEDVRD